MQLQLQSQKQSGDINTKDDRLYRRHVVKHFEKTETPAGTLNIKIPYWLLVCTLQYLSSRLPALLGPKHFSQFLKALKTCCFALARNYSSNPIPSIRQLLPKLLQRLHQSKLLLLTPFTRFSYHLLRLWNCSCRSYRCCCRCCLTAACIATAVDCSCYTCTAAASTTCCAAAVAIGSVGCCFSC